MITFQIYLILEIISKFKHILQRYSFVLIFESKSFLLFLKQFFSWSKECLNYKL